MPFPCHGVGGLLISLRQFGDALDHGVGKALSAHSLHHFFEGRLAFELFDLRLQCLALQKSVLTPGRGPLVEQGLGVDRPGGQILGVLVDPALVAAVLQQLNLSLIPDGSSGLADVEFPAQLVQMGEGMHGCVKAIRADVVNEACALAFLGLQAAVVVTAPLGIVK